MPQSNLPRPSRLILEWRACRLLRQLKRERRHPKRSPVCQTILLVAPPVEGDQVRFRKDPPMMVTPAQSSLTPRHHCERHWLLRDH